MTKKLMIMAAGTGGHIFPGIAIAQTMRARGWEVSWLGTAHGMETELVPKAGIDMDTIDFAGLRGKGLAHTIKGAFKMAAAFATCRRYLAARRPDVVLGMGGYVTVPGGVMARADVLDRPDIAALMRLAHDAFVRLVEGLAALDDGNGARRPGAVTAVYRRDVGIAASIDVMLATADSNRAIHRNWLDLVLFSTVLAGNLQRFDARRALGDDRLAPAHAVRASLIARVLNVSETTVRRRLATLTVPGGPVIRLREGFLLSESWLTNPDAIETSRRTYETIRLIVAQAVAQGFPIDDPASAYLEGPPPVVSFA